MHNFVLLTCKMIECYHIRAKPCIAEVVELADALRSGRSELYARGGSNPPFGTKKYRIYTVAYLAIDVRIRASIFHFHKAVPNLHNTLTYRP